MSRHADWMVSALSWCIFGCFWSLSTPANAQASEHHYFDIPAQDLGRALTLFGQQAEREIVFQADLTRHKQSNAIHGDMKSEEALDTLLAGSGLSARVTGQGSFAVERTGDPLVSANGAADLAGPKRGSSTAGSALDEIVVTGTHIRGQAPVGSELIIIDRDQIDASGKTNVQDVFASLPQNFGGGVGVTYNDGRDGPTNFARSSALNLRGLGPEATLVLIDGHRLAPAGARGTFVDVSTIPIGAIERIEVLPDGASAIYGSDAIGGVVNIITRKNYEGAETSVQIGTVADAGAQDYRFSQVFGHQWDTGHALVFYQYLKQEPVFAADRLQSASADLTPFGGSDFRSQVSNPGNIFVGSQNWAIPANQNGKSLTAAELIPNTFNLGNQNTLRDLRPRETHNNIAASISQDIGDRVVLNVDGSFGKRDDLTLNHGFGEFLTVPSTNPYYVNPTGGTDPIGVLYDFTKDLGPQRDSIDERTYTLNVGTVIAASTHWNITANVGLVNDKIKVGFPNINSDALAAALADSNPATALNVFGDGSFTNPSTLASLLSSDSEGTNSRLWTADLLADGPLMTLPSGDVKLAAGAGFRRENFTFTHSSALTDDVEFSRNVRSAFVEMVVPIVKPDAQRTGLNQLDLSAAERYESYSDFGHALVPKLGLNWTVLPGYSVRGSWSKSYRAPNVTDLVESQNQSILLPLVDPKSPTEFTNALVVVGGNKDLTQETATTLSLGLEAAPPEIPELQIDLTYFHINFTNRIESIPDFSVALSDPTLAPVVTRNPTAAQLQAVCSASTYGGASPADCANPSLFGAIVDDRVRNISVLKNSGIDLLASYAMVTPVGTWMLTGNTAYVNTYSEALVADSPPTSLLNTELNPVKWKLRGSLSWSRQGLGAGVFVNHIGHYEDTISQPERNISSWTTFDLNLSYKTQTDSGHWFSNATIAFNVQNLFNKDPPFLNNVIGLGYDPTNANVWGRILSLSLRKGW